MPRDYKRRKPLKEADYRALRSVLADWYGRDRGNLEMDLHTAQLLPLGEAVGEVLNEFVAPEYAAAAAIAEKFPEIMGMPLAKFTKFNSLCNGVAVIEVSHPAWLAELSGALKPRIIDNINRAVGEKVCRDAKFVPFGR